MKFGKKTCLTFPNLILGTHLFFAFVRDFLNAFYKVTTEHNRLGDATQLSQLYPKVSLEPSIMAKNMAPGATDGLWLNGYGKQVALVDLSLAKWHR